MATIQRRRPRNVPHSFESQLAAGVDKLEAQAATMATGPARDKIRARIRDLQAAEQMNEWLSMPRR
jgi:hypothetical protein